MTTLKSLSSFFNTADPTTLNNCDREAIHLSGKIQDLGALLIVDLPHYKIIGVSENAPDFLGHDCDSLLGASLDQIDETLARQVLSMPEEGKLLHQILEYDLTVGTINYDCVAHVHDGKLIVEFVPNRTVSTKEVRTAMRQCSRACSLVLQSDTFSGALQIAVDAVRELTGFSRAKIYRFQADWSGEVIAQSSDGKLPSYLGLCFPDSDIPVQVREVMKIVPYRAIGQVTDDSVRILSNGFDVAELDLTWSILRSVSTMHTQYLRNIGVACSFSCSLMHEGELWGMFAIHHDSATLLPFDFWGLVQEIGTALMLRFAQEQRVNIANSINRLRLIESKFASQLRLGGEVEDVIADLVPELRGFLGADGFAFQFGSSLHLSGETPPPEFIADLIAWAAKNSGADDQFQTNALHTIYPPGAGHIDTACGVLIQPMLVHRVCQLIWFRGPLTRTVKWAGRPGKRNDQGKTDILTPRNSFDTWVQDHNDQSAPWTEDALQCAREIFSEFLDIVTAQLLLKQENAELRQFAATAAHDLKAPLRGINFALDWMSEDDFDPDAVRTNHAMAKQSSLRVNELTEGLLEFALIENQPLRKGPVDLNEVIETVKEMLFRQMEETNATVTFSSLPTLECDRGTLLRVFMNLLSNSMKFQKPGVAPVAHISAQDCGNQEVVLSISDNGMGIDPKYAERIFRPLERLHSKDEIEGTGLGLAICERIVKLHGGTIALDELYTDGACFRISMPHITSAAQ